MIVKSLVFLSLICNLIGFNLSASGIDQKIANYYSVSNLQSAIASQNEPQSNIAFSPSVNSIAQKPAIKAKYYTLIDDKTGATLISQNENQPVPIASTTKIMTAVIALENYKLTDIVSVPSIATEENPEIVPTIVYLQIGEKISVSELLHCMLIESGNDAAFALGSFMDNGKSTSSFVAKMNQKAKDLGMTETHYLDPAGLNDSGHSSAHDLGIITRYALLNPTFRQIVSTEHYVATNTTRTLFHTLENSNRLVTTYQYPGAIGVKTGFTDAAGHCLIAAAKRNNQTLISVVLDTNLNTANASADESRKLLDWGFANVSWSD